MVEFAGAVAEALLPAPLRLWVWERVIACWLCGADGFSAMWAAGPAPCFFLAAAGLGVVDGVRVVVLMGLLV